MNIADNAVVNLNYKLTDDEGEVIDQCSDGGFCYLHGAGNIIPGLEQALLGKTVGETFSVRIAPEQAYGVRRDDRVQQVPRSMFPADAEIEPGMQFHAQGPEGQQIVVTVAAVSGAEVVVDGNHPLAGVHLTFAVEVVAIRAASDEELAHGHVHGPGGHHHD